MVIRNNKPESILCIYQWHEHWKANIPGQVERQRFIKGMYEPVL